MHPEWEIQEETSKKEKGETMPFSISQLISVRLESHVSSELSSTSILIVLDRQTTTHVLLMQTRMGDTESTNEKGKK